MVGLFVTFGAYMRVLATILYFAAAIWSQTSFADALEEFGNQMSYFYLSPSQDKFNAIQRNADNLREKLEESQNGADILVAVMVAKISKKHQWPIINSAFGLRAKEIMDGKSSLAKYVLDDSQVDPTKLDVWWASFFAVGEEKYLDNIFQYAGLELPKGDLGKMLVIGAASWSFKANCKQHQKVLEFARQKLRSPSVPEVQKIFIKECIAFAEGKGTEQGAPGDAREAAHP